MMATIFFIAPPIFDVLASAGIGGLAALMAFISAIIYAKGNTTRAILLTGGLAVMMGVSAFAARSGLLTRFDIFPPPMAIMIISVFTIAFAVGFSRLGKSLASEISLTTLIALQIFRLPLELVMHRAAELDIMPVQMSYSGYNFDIFTGIGALILAFLLSLKIKLSPVVIWVWNVWGMWCLLVIAVVAIATSPMVHAFGAEPTNLNTWVLFFPYVWLPVILVTLALTGHIIITRKLLRQRAS